MTKAHARPVQAAAIAAKTPEKDAFDPMHAEIRACRNTLLASPHAGGCSPGTPPRATAPGTAAVHALPDTLLAGDLVRNVLPGRLAAATPAIDGLLDDGRIHLRRHGLLVLRTHALERSSERAQAEPRPADWRAAAGRAASWPDGAADGHPRRPACSSTRSDPRPRSRTGQRPRRPGPDDLGLKPPRRPCRGRTWIPLDPPGSRNP